MKDAPLIWTERLTKRYGNMEAVRSLNLMVRPKSHHRIPRTKRRRQEHNDQDDPRNDQTYSVRVLRFAKDYRHGA